MSVFSKIIVACLIVLSALFVKDKFFHDYKFNFFNKSHISTSNVVAPEQKVSPEAESLDEDSTMKPQDKKHNKTLNVKQNTVTVSFLSDGKNDVQYVKTVKRNINSSDKLTVAIQQLLKGPKMSEAAKGSYSEIPKGTKLLGIKYVDDKAIINLSSDFEYGGGSDSLSARMKQLIQTALANSSGKKVYLYIDGKQVDVIGGDGLMVTQPLSEKSLDE